MSEHRSTPPGSLFASSTSAATPIGNCPRCGLTRYENLVHHCGTAVAPVTVEIPPTEDAWELTSEPFAPLYIGLLPHNTRRMLQALDGYWLHCDGLPKGRYPRGRYTAEDWFTRFEKYRAKVEAEL